MRRSIQPKSWIIGLAGLLTVALCGMGLAADQGSSAQAGANPGTSAAGPQQHAQMLIEHAVDLAINGSDLQFIAEPAGNRQGQQGQNQPGQGQQGQNPAGQGQQGQNQDPVQELQQQARQRFEASNQLLQEASKAIGSESSDSATRRFYTVAQQYINTLRAFSGQPAQEPGQKTTQGGQAGESNAGNLSHTEVASVALINQAVKDGIGSVELQRMTHWASSSQGTLAQQMRQHAQQLQGYAQKMQTNSQQILQRFGVGGQQSGTLASSTARPQGNPAQATGQQAGGQHGQASVQTLARQAREVVQAVQQIDRTAGSAHQAGQQENRSQR